MYTLRHSKPLYSGEVIAVLQIVIGNFLENNSIIVIKCTPLYIWRVREFYFNVLYANKKYAYI